MNNDIEQTKGILWAYINKELTNDSRLIEYIINQNMRDLVVTDSIRETEEYRIILQELFSNYQANKISENDTKNVINDDIIESSKQEQKYITLKDRQAISISSSDILHYEFRESEQLIFSTISAQTIYKDILEYLVSHGYSSIIGNRYIPMPTMERWYEMVGNSADGRIQDKYRPFGKNHMLFVSITPANIMRKLIHVFDDLRINLTDFRIYLRDDVQLDNTTRRLPSVTSDKPDLIYDPNNEDSFYLHELEFKRDLLKYKRAKKITYKTDNTVDEQIWNASNFSPTSDLKANIITNNKIREYKRDRILDRIEFFIIR